ncbi:MAG: uracil-DNA glycosylase [Alphaproteobacteria bacterium]|nr:uracil-DNA glycosylase [Alphaproteobacteria bacterium]
MNANADLKKLLLWQMEAGADEAILDHPVNHYHAQAGQRQSQAKQPQLPKNPTKSRDMARGMDEGAPAPAPRPSPSSNATPPPGLHTTDEALHDARSLAHAAESMDDLAERLRTYEGCSLKKTATNMVFGDGNIEAPIMFVGEAPGADEDRLGRPFVGVSGQLLDRMMAAIGLDRDSAYISNILPWRPPGNRNPTPAEISLCLPFIERQIELVAPHILVLVGGTAAKTLLGRKEGIMKLRGQWFDYASPGLSCPVKARAIFHPAYLLRSPAQKQKAWQDLLEIKIKMSGDL